MTALSFNSAILPRDLNGLCWGTTTYLLRWVANIRVHHSLFAEESAAGINKVDESGSKFFKTVRVQ
ncbi:hypothetical protein EYF80_012631 [Liparis tanakae]|uniref:Uncharacterized protein n=1 Tax=Liparis tanakae TaxID=230148 RepID=A0A4Z2IIR4_9TELE|nr:hypothetical protein EYF80_012631 [Liparis tanakae]